MRRPKKGDPEVAWLYQAGRSIDFIAVQLRMSSRMVRSHLLSYGFDQTPPFRQNTQLLNHERFNTGPCR